MKTFVGVFVTCLLLTSYPTFADPLDVWISRNPVPNNCWWAAVAYGDGQFVAVGYSGTIVTSTDGLHWIRRPSEVNNTLRNLAYQNGTWVIVGDRTIFPTISSPGCILTSSDGMNWSRQDAPPRPSLLYGNGSFVVAGGDDRFGYSSDGREWKWQNPGAGTLELVRFGNGRFVGLAEKSYLMTTDFTNWNQTLHPTHVLGDLAFGNGRFVAVGWTDTFRRQGIVTSSEDGTNWTIVATTNREELPDRIRFVGGRFVVSLPSDILRSADGVNWVRGGPLPDLELSPPARSESGHVVAIREGRLFTDGRTLEPVKGLGTNLLTSIIYGNGRFVAKSGGYSPFQILASPDGAHWDAASQPTNKVDLVAHGQTRTGSRFVSVSTEGRVFVSADGLQWHASAFLSGRGWSGPFFANGRFLVFGENETAAISEDATIWKTSQVEYPNVGRRLSFRALTFGAGRFIGLTGWGVIAASVNGLQWDFPLTKNLPEAYSLAFGRGVFVAGSSGPRLYVSSDAITWTTTYSSPPTTLAANVSAITYGPPGFVAVGGQWNILTSVDGNSWVMRDSGLSLEPRISLYSEFSGVTFGNDTYVAVGGAGVIVQSAPITRSRLEEPRVYDHKFEFDFVGGPTSAYRIQTTTNLASPDWTDVATIENGPQLMSFADERPSHGEQRFYRVVGIPMAGPGESPP